MYLEFYGLAEGPFSLTSNPRFIYNSRAFLAAWTAVARAVDERQGIVVITGESGVGKSMLCRALLEKLGADIYLSAIANPRVSADEFLRQVLADFGVGDLSDVPPDAHAIVLVDEAQHLGLGVFEKIRFLMNLESDKGKSLQLLLVGPPDLQARLQQPLLRSFRQRVACWATLSALEPDEVAPYIDSRLRVARGDAAGSGVEFTPPAIEAITAASQGNPRLINVLADRALDLGHERAVHTIDRQTARAAIARAGLEASRRGPTLARWAAVAVVAAALAGSALWWPLGIRRAPLKQSEAVTAQPAPATATTVPASPATAQPPPSPPPAVAEPPAPVPPPPGEGTLAAADSLLVSLGPFKDADRAGVVTRELAAGGLPAFTRADAAATSHLVLVGPYVSREEAVEAQRQTAALGYPDGRIIAGRP